MRYRALDAEGDTLFELIVNDVCSQGRATDWIRQRGPIATLEAHWQGTPDQVASSIEARLEHDLAFLGTALEAPLAVFAAAIAVMKRQGFGRIVLRLPTSSNDETPAKRSIVSASRAFWRAWISDVSAGELAAHPHISIELCDQPD